MKISAKLPTIKLDGTVKVFAHLIPTIAGLKYVL